MNDPLTMIRYNRQSMLNLYQGAVRDLGLKDQSRTGSWMRGAMCGYKIALRQARRLLKGVREKKAQGWTLLWVNKETLAYLFRVPAPGEWYEAKID